MDLSKQFDLEQVPEPQRSSILTTLTEIVLSKLTLAAYDKLSPEDQAAIENMDEDSTTPEQIIAFLEARVPDLEQITDTIISDEKAELAAKTQQLATLITEDQASDMAVEHDRD